MASCSCAIDHERTPGTPEASHATSPLHKLEHALHKPVAFLIVPIFGFANAGVSFTGVSPAVLLEPLTLGVAAGLVFGKLIGVLGSVALLGEHEEMWGAEEIAVYGPTSAL